MTLLSPPPSIARNQDRLYELAVAAHGLALDRLARSYEADADNRDDLLQEIHLSLWRSLSSFDERCSLRTKYPEPSIDDYAKPPACWAAGADAVATFE